MAPSPATTKRAAANLGRRGEAASPAPQGYFWVRASELPCFNTCSDTVCEVPSDMPKYTATTYVLQIARPACLESRQYDLPGGECIAPTKAQADLH